MTRESRTRTRRCLAAAMSAGWLGVSSIEEALRGLKCRRHTPDLRKCALPGCEKMAEKTYCCAEHCRLHRERQRAGRFGKEQE